MSSYTGVGLDMGAVRFWSWAIAVAGAAFALLHWKEGKPVWVKSRAGFALAGALCAVACIWPSGLGRVQAGARGVVLRFGAPTGRALGEGLYYVVPVAERVVQVNMQINTIRLDRAQGICKDLEPVYADLAVSFHVVPEHAVEVYRLLRDDYAARIVYPAAEDAWKATVARYASADVIAQRPRAQRELESDLAARVSRFGLAVDTVATTRLNFAYAYAQAAQAKVAAGQRSLQAQQDLQRVRFEAQQSVIRAKSEVEALQLQRSVPIAQVVRLRQLELQRRAIDKWDGRLPQTMGATPFLGSALGQHGD